jgi:hypothetical protein
MGEYGVSEDRFQFLAGDAHSLLASFAPLEFDTVFCFGFLYHTLDQMGLILSIARLRPRWLVLDTAVIKSDEPLIELRTEDSENEGNGVRRAVDGPGPLLVGMPSLPALDMMLGSAGFDYSVSDWHSSQTGDWAGLEDYRDRRRLTIVASLGA